MDEQMLRAVALQAAAGDTAAFAELRQAAEPTVRDYVAQKIREPSLVPGLTEVVFDVAQRAIGQFPESGLDAWHWLLRVARWVVVRYHEFCRDAAPG